MSRPTRIEIDLNALAHNRQQVSRYAPDSKVICCVKANAYGHGMVEVARALAPSTDALAVASIEEALLLSENGLALPILLLEGFFQAEELALISELGLWAAVHNDAQLQQLKRYSEFENNNNPEKRPIDIWLKIDTGMHRLGFAPEKVKDVYTSLQSLEVVGNIRLMTHFACADELDNPFTENQLKTFAEASQGIETECSMANSAGILAWPDSHKDWVRPGYMLYGQSPFGQDHATSQELEPVMTFQTQVIDIKTVAAGEGIGYNHSWRTDRETDIAVLAAGYGDGYPRNTKNGAPVLIAGQIARTVGHVAMDMMMVDITGLNSIYVGSEAELWGKNLSVNEVAAYSGYSPYELLTRIPPRIERNYISLESS